MLPVHSGSCWLLSGHGEKEANFLSRKNVIPAGRPWGTGWRGIIPICSVLSQARVLASGDFSQALNPPNQFGRRQVNKHLLSTAL